jgi:hypothetical protein
MKQSLKYMALAATVAVGAGLGTAQAQTIPTPCGGKSTVVVNSRINASTTWTAGNEYILTNITYVTSGATLTIEPGTVIRGLSDANTPGANNAGALVITTGSKIIANGTKSNPIVFTDEADDNVPGCTATAPYNAYQQLTGQWGGLIVLGKTYIGFNTPSGPTPTKQNQIEGVTAEGSLGLYGGNNDDDDSGSLSYISLRYGGGALAPNSEINGLTMGGVGRATKVSFIEVVNNLDDAFEFFGGTVNCKYMTSFGAGDDGWDTDEGYRGKAQFVSIIQADAGGVAVGSGIPDRGFESDGGLNPDQSQPYSLSVVYNFTLVGKGQTGGGGTYTKREENVGAMLRDNAGQQIYNSVFVDFGGPAIAISNEGSETNINCRTRWVTPYNDLSFHLSGPSGLPASAFYKTQTEGFQADFRDNVVWQCGVTSGMGVVGTASNWETIRGDTAAHSGGEPPNPFNENWRSGLIGSSYNNVIATINPITTLTRSATAAANRMFNPTFVDPRPATLSDARTVTRKAPADGFFTPVGYKGAFAPDGCLWTTGWTLQSALGLLPSVSCPAAGSITDITLLSSVTFPTTAGGVYIVNASSDNINFIPIGVVVGTGSNVTFVDERGLATRQFYNVTSQ